MESRSCQVIRLEWHRLICAFDRRCNHGNAHIGYFRFLPKFRNHVSIDLIIFGRRCRSNEYTVYRLKIPVIVESIKIEIIMLKSSHSSHTSMNESDFVESTTSECTQNNSINSLQLRAFFFLAHMCHCTARTHVITSHIANRCMTLKWTNSWRFRWTAFVRRFRKLNQFESIAIAWYRSRCVRLYWVHAPRCLIVMFALLSSAEYVPIVSIAKCLPQCWNRILNLSRESNLILLCKLHRSTLQINSFLCGECLKNRLQIYCTVATDTM